jgi:hypothetical protein
MKDKTQFSIGKTLDTEMPKDAIHIAVAPVVASSKLAPGQDIGFVHNDRERVGACPNPIGIVDPFLSAVVMPGQRFWMFLYPNSITSLRHDWTHPAWGGPESSIEASKRWIAEFGDDIASLSFDGVIEAARAHLRSGEYHTLNYDTPDRAWTDNDEFWRHYEIVTGEKVPEGERHSFFSCSC